MIYKADKRYRCRRAIVEAVDAGRCKNVQMVYSEDHRQKCQRVKMEQPVIPHVTHRLGGGRNLDGLHIAPTVIVGRCWVYESLPAVCQRFVNGLEINGEKIEIDQIW